MNQLLKNLLKIHEKIEDVESFIPIKTNIESLKDDANYRKLVADTDLLIKVLEAFSRKE